MRIQNSFSSFCSLILVLLFLFLITSQSVTSTSSPTSLKNLEQQSPMPLDMGSNTITAAGYDYEDSILYYSFPNNQPTDVGYIYRLSFEYQSSTIEGTDAYATIICKATCWEDLESGNSISIIGLHNSSDNTDIYLKPPFSLTNDVLFEIGNNNPSINVTFSIDIALFSSPEPSSTDPLPFPTSTVLVLILVPIIRKLIK